MTYTVYKDIEGKRVEIRKTPSKASALFIARKWKDKGYYVIQKCFGKKEEIIKE